MCSGPTAMVSARSSRKFDEVDRAAPRLQPAQHDVSQIAYSMLRASTARPPLASTIFTSADQAVVGKRLATKASTGSAGPFSQIWPYGRSGK